MDLDGASVGIIGGTGRMGTWFSGVLEKRGHTVLRAGRNSGASIIKTISNCEIAVVCVPIESTPQVIKRIGPMLRPEGLLIDLTSLKVEPLKAMLRHYKGEVVGLHPLFGPDADKSKGPLNIAVCPGRGNRGLVWIEEALSSEGYEVGRIGAEEHDRIMGVVQGLNHFSMLCLSLSLSRCGVTPEELETWSTPSFRIMLGRIKSLLSQPGELFRALIMENPASGGYIEDFASLAGDLAEAVRSKKKDEFLTLFNQLEKVFVTDRRGI
jgi:prephenate dehydrogenase